MSYMEQEQALLEMEAKLISYLQDAKEEDEISRKVYELKEKIEEFKTIIASNLNTWDRVQIARNKLRPTSFDYIERIFDDFTELHGDRLFGDDQSIIGGIATLNGMAVTVIGQQKGRSVEENIKRNFGMPNPEGYRKTLRLMKQAEKFNRPIVLFVDTPGAYPGLGAEERGQGEAIAKNLMEMSQLKVPIISIIIGEGGSGGALALAVADQVWMLENSIYSILSPEGFATILYKDASLASKVCDDMKLTAKDLLEMNMIDRLIDEPLFGLKTDHSYIFLQIKDLLVKEFQTLSLLQPKKLIRERYARYRRMGKYEI